MCPQCLPKYSCVTSKRGLLTLKNMVFTLNKYCQSAFLQLLCPGSSCAGRASGDQTGPRSRQEDTRKFYKTISKARQSAGIQDRSIIIIVLTSFRAVGVRTLLVLKIATSTLSLFLKWVSNQACKWQCWWWQRTWRRCRGWQSCW